MADNLKVAKIMEQIIDLDLLDDRYGYDIEQLKLTYELTDHEANNLYNLIRAGTDPDYNIQFQNPTDVLEMILEAIHQGLDGWEDDEKVVIESFIADIALAVSRSNKAN